VSALRLTPEASEKILLAPSQGMWGDLAVLWLALARVAVAAGMGAVSWAVSLLTRT